jgi:superfamily II DNA or RNA helicase
MVDTAVISQSLQYLAGICDGARKQDGVGFNKFDSDYGKQLATTSQMGELSEKQLSQAIVMLRKYRSQLAECGLVIPQELIDLYAKNYPSLYMDNGRIAVKFPAKPKQDILDFLRSIPGRFYNGEAWTFPASAASTLTKLYPEVNALDLTPPTPKPDYATKDAPDSPDATLSLQDGLVIVRFGKGSDKFFQNLEAVKKLGERRYLVEKKLWAVPLRHAVDLYNCLTGKVEIDPELKKIIATQKELAAMSNKSASDFAIPNIRPGNEFLPFQRAGVEFLEKAKRALIGDQMGLGKTIQAIGYLALHPELRPAIIVVPASLKINWQRELKKWLATPDIVAVCSGSNNQTAQLFGSTIVIINYDILGKWNKNLISLNPKLLIVDECHYIKSKKTLRSRAVSELSKSIPEVIFLTGTPIVNRPIELFPVLHIIDAKSWPSERQYFYRYCYSPTQASLQELHNLIKPYVVRRTKEQVLKELPLKRRAVVTVQFDKSEWHNYISAIEKAKAEPKAAEQLRLIEAAKQAAVRGKLSAALDWIEDFIETEKLVVFCTHNFVVDAIMAKFSNRAVRLTGSENNQERQKAVDDFQTKDSVKLFVGNLRAAGVGITLTAASNVAFVELDWTPGGMSQAEDRVHRIGQLDSVTAWYIVAENTIEEKIVELLEQKRIVTDTVHDGVVGDTEFSIAKELIEYILQSNGGTPLYNKKPAYGS